MVILASTTKCSNRQTSKCMVAEVKNKTKNTIGVIVRVGGKQMM